MPEMGTVAALIFSRVTTHSRSRLIPTSRTSCLATFTSTHVSVFQRLGARRHADCLALGAAPGKPRHHGSPRGWVRASTAVEFHLHFHQTSPIYKDTPRPIFSVSSHPTNMTVSVALSCFSRF